MLSKYAEQQIARMSTHAKFPYLIKITNYIDYETAEIYRYANADEDITYGGEVYHASIFSIDPPKKDGSKIGEAALSISAVDQQWIIKIRTTQIPASIQFVATIVYNDGNISGVEAIEEMDFALRGAQWNQDTISWSMSFDENMAILVPPDKATAQKAPGAA
jgi:hypothetical protein